MDYKLIKAMLDRYFEGESSLEEEAHLRTYFGGEEVDSRLLAYKPLFVVLQAEAQASLPEAQWDRWQPSPDKPAARLRVQTYHKWIAVAASVALALAVWRWYPQAAPASQAQAVAVVDWSKYEVTDPEEALRITKKALGRTSRELNRGAKKAASEISRVKKMAKPL